MLKIANYRYFNFILHALAWSIILFFPYLVSDAVNQYKIGPLPGFYFTLSGFIHIIIFYGNSLLLYPKLFNRTYWPLYVVSAILLVYVSVVVKSYILSQWFPGASQDARTHVLFPSVLTFLVSVFYSIAVERIRAEKLQKENEAMQLAIELKFLRSQISPHFLFNILTNLVSLARKKSDNLESSLLMLSGLMRYMLYTSGKKISMEQEAEYLENYIALQELRFGRNVKIIFNKELSNEDSNSNIEPMLLIPFIENAFKHGTGYMDQPFIDIDLKVKDGVLVFRVKNKFDLTTDTSKYEASGIGLNNVRSRLTLLYPDSHELFINTDQNLYNVNLTIKLL